MQTGYNDAPIKSLTEDLFDVKNYVGGLCKFILECETPMTVSIQGDWGSGKTSMMNMIQTKLGKRVLPIWFNTWQFSQFQLGNSLAISMLEVLLKELGGDTKILDGITHRMTDMIKITSVAALERLLGSIMASKAENFLDSFSEKSCVQEITELKNKFQEAIAAKIKAPIERVVVFVDDLDRLEPAKAIELLEVLKLFIDCKDCVFVLAVDYEVVTLGIRQKYGSDINAAKGKSFFDKIIQLPFKMPVAQYDIKKYTESMMTKMQIKDKANTNVELFSSLIKTSVGLNPRSMKRLFNTYQLLYNIMPDEIKVDNFRQRILFAVVCMQMSFEAVYDYLLAGNVDADTLKNLVNVDDKAVKNFLLQRTLNQGDAEILEDDILNSVFRSETSLEELRGTLQKFPTFIKLFVAAISANNAEKLSDKEVDYLRGILKHSAITSVKSENKSEATQRAVEIRQKNRDLVQKINKVLEDKRVGKFVMPQADSSSGGIISTFAAGYCIYTCDNKKYQMRYVTDMAENKIMLSIYLNGYEQPPKYFYDFMGDNPLEYKKLPVTNATPGWYFYDDLFIFDEADENLVASVAAKVQEAVSKLKKKIDGNLT